MKKYNWNLKTGISRSPGFEKKKLAEFSCNVGLKCGHGCTYCSTGAMVRAHKAFKRLDLSPFDNGYAIVDPDAPVRVARDARNKRKRGLVQLCTTVDAWSPEAQKYDLGRRPLEAILSQPGWTVRILTKNASVINDFEVIEKYRDRILFGMSITAAADKDDVISVIEPNASTITERVEVMEEATKRGFRTFAMFCPILRGISEEPYQIEQLVKLAARWKVEQIFAEPVNPRGKGLIMTHKALYAAGFYGEAGCVETVRFAEQWSWNSVQIIRNLQQSLRKHYDIGKLRFLLYSGRLHPLDANRIKEDDTGVIWL